MVTVWKLPLRRPRFRFEVGCEGPENKVFRQFSVFSEGQGKLSFKHSWDGKVASELVSQALEYICGELQAAEDEWIEFRASRERSSLDRDKPKQQAGLKQLVKKDKILRDLKNSSK